MSDEAEVIKREIFIGAAPETVFQFLINADLMTHWLGAFHRSLYLSRMAAFIAAKN
jgi:uncharacterized protein YndB with AHSA1/START domain